jgi:rRNA processing protein Gar1
MRTFRKHRDVFGLYKSPYFNINCKTKPALGNTTALKHTVKLNPCAEYYYYVLNVNRARVKRNNKKLYNKNENTC